MTATALGSSTEPKNQKSSLIASWITLGVPTVAIDRPACELFKLLTGKAKFG